MAMTIDEKIAALEDALASGTLKVEYDGRSVTYRSTAELQQALTYFKGQKAAATGGGSVRVSIGGYWR